MTGKLVAGILGLALAAAGGCRSPRPESPPAPPPPAAIGPRGEVIRVNEQHRYVVLRCEVLPSGPEQATLYRNGRPVGRILVNGPARPPFAIADVLEGKPQPGDRAAP